MSSSFSQISRFFSRLTGRQPPPGKSGDAPIDPDQPGGSARLACGHQLIRPIGQGAYGEVWLARDEIGNYHAVKIVQRDRFADKAPFEREYRGLLQYTPISRTHHALVHVLSVGRDTDNGCFFYVMELADCITGGRNIDPATYTPHTLEHVLTTRKHLSVAECVRLGLELCEGLAYLHSRQLIHRDIKPANIIFVNQLAKLADIGLITHVAEARRDPKHLGTEGFIPPEGPGTPLADVYSLGKVLSEAAFGRESTENMTNPASTPPPGSDALREVLAKACHEDAQSRYQSAVEFQNDLIQVDEQLQLAGGDSATP